MPAMDWVSLTFVILAIVLCVVSHVWWVISAFRVSVLWGLLVLFVPVMPLMFLLVHWEDARKPFFCMLLALVTLVPPMALNWETIDRKKNETVEGILRKHGQLPPELDNSPPAVLARKRAALIKHANEMNAKYADLLARQKNLATADDATKAAFTADTEAYSALRQQVEAEKAEVEALEQAAKVSSQQPVEP
jgi:hypothetical protein